jgi:hypothetical protein
MDDLFGQKITAKTTFVLPDRNLDKKLFLAGMDKSFD